MVARRYGIYLRVFTSISNELAQRTSEISNVNTRPCIQASMYYSVYYIDLLMTAFLTIFRRFHHFPKISEDFPKLLRRPDERSRTFSESFWKFPKMSENFRRLLKIFEEDPKMFWRYTNYFSWYQWNHRYLHTWGYRIVFMNLIPLGIPPNFIQ